MADDVHERFKTMAPQDVGPLLRPAFAVGLFPHRMLSDAQRCISSRAPDEALYALAMYLYSLQPPPNPNRSDPRISFLPTVFLPAGQKTRAVKGHEFGLRLNASEKAALLAFLRSL